MGSTDSGAGQHGDGRFRNHRHVEGHQIPLANAHGLQRIGCLAHLGMQFSVSETADIAGFPFPDQSRLVGRFTVKMPVKTIVGEVGGASLEPASEGRVGPVEHLLKRREPIEFLASRIAPERFRIVPGCIGHGLIGIHATNPC